MMFPNFIGLLAIWDRPDKIFSCVPLESKGEEEDIPYREPQMSVTIWSCCNSRDQCL